MAHDAPILQQGEIVSFDTFMQSVRLRGAITALNGDTSTNDSNALVSVMGGTFAAYLDKGATLKKIGPAILSEVADANKRAAEKRGIADEDLAFMVDAIPHALALIALGEATGTRIIASKEFITSHLRKFKIAFGQNNEVVAWVIPEQKVFAVMVPGSLRDPVHQPFMMSTIQSLQQSLGAINHAVVVDQDGEIYEVEAQESSAEDPPIGGDEPSLDASLAIHDAVMGIYSRIPEQLDVADEDEVKEALVNWGTAFVAVTTALTVPQVQALAEAKRLRPLYLGLMQVSMQLLMQFEQMLDGFATTIEGDDKAQWDFKFTQGLNNSLLTMAKEGGTPYASIASKSPMHGSVMSRIFNQEFEGFDPELHLAVVINSLLVAMAATRLGDVPYPYIQGHEWELPRAKPFFSGDPDVHHEDDDAALSLAGFTSVLTEHANKVGVSTFIADMRNPASAMGVIQSISGGGYPIPPGHSVYGRPNLLGVPPTY